MPIKLTCLGHGNAFSNENIGNSAYLIEYEDQRILLDCGTTVPAALGEFGLNPGLLTGIFISHLHADHVGGLERILYHRRFISKAEPIPLIMGNMTSSDWLGAIGAIGLFPARAKDYVNLIPLRESDEYIEISPLGLKARSYRTVHGENELSHLSCYSFMLDVGGHQIFFSGDRIWSHVGDGVIRDALLEADTVLHEIELSATPSGCHTHHTELPEWLRWNNKLRCHHHAANWEPGERPAKFNGLQLMFKGDVIRLT